MEFSTPSWLRFLRRLHQIKARDNSSQAGCIAGAGTQFNAPAPQAEVIEGTQAARDLLKLLHGLPDEERSAVIAHAIGDLVSVSLDPEENKATLARIQGFSTALADHIREPANLTAVAEQRAEHWREKLQQKLESSKARALSLLLSVVFFMRPELAKAAEMQVEVANDH